jgi:hypothetical protein
MKIFNIKLSVQDLKDVIDGLSSSTLDESYTMALIESKEKKSKEDIETLEKFKANTKRYLELINTINSIPGYKAENVEVEKEWNDFWKDIVCNEDESVNIEQLKKELSDYSFILRQVPKVYSHITNGTLSKVNYKAETVINEFEFHQTSMIEKEMAKDDLLMMLNGEISEDLKQEIEKYFTE